MSGSGAASATTAEMSEADYRKLISKALTKVRVDGLRRQSVG
jgi:hypothetical protein